MLLRRQMKNLVVISALVFAACSHGGNAATTPSGPAPGGGPATVASGTDADPSVDPTLPSWAPRSCTAYHAAVVQLLDCEAVPQSTRDAAKTKYDADHAKWQAMQEQPQGAVEEVRQSCADQAKAVGAQMNGKCR